MGINLPTQLNEQVHALTTLPNGTVVAGGEFTQANGQPATEIVGLDPTTGLTAAGWNLKVENRVTSGAPPLIRTLDVQGNWLYLGGAFTHLTGGTRTTAVVAKNLGRIDASTLIPGTLWNPKLNGTVNDVDASDDGQQVYAVGYFGTSNGHPAFRAAALSTATGAALSPGFSPTWSNSNKNYQRTVQQVGSQVYIGGSEHSLFGFRRSDMARVSGSIMKKHGDVQAISSNGQGVIYAGCHCFNYAYQNAFTWSTLSAGWTEGDAIDWIGAWDAATGKYLPSFLPQMGTGGSGVWAIMTDSVGNLWVGGDINTVTTKTTTDRWSGGFARFASDDNTAPGTPANFHVVSQTATTVTLGWNNVADPSGTTFQVLRDDRPILGLNNTGPNTTEVTVPRTGATNKYFVRAIDGAGNISASTVALTVSG